MKYNGYGKKFIILFVISLLLFLLLILITKDFNLSIISSPHLEDSIKTEANYYSDISFSFIPSNTPINNDLTNQKSKKDYESVKKVQKNTTEKVGNKSLQENESISHIENVMSNTSKRGVVPYLELIIPYGYTEDEIAKIYNYSLGVVSISKKDTLILGIIDNNSFKNFSQIDKIFSNRGWTAFDVDILKFVNILQQKVSISTESISAAWLVPEKIDRYFAKIQESAAQQAGLKFNEINYMKGSYKPLLKSIVIDSIFVKNDKKISSRNM